ncbi:hypothetical protein QT972_16550 [Microcoleus sp. herbarium7]|uniref:hypothetical protein n=1 Tax=Microcoleus sp. herbarium7 TaxID=3055435 RepID=UPI002FD0A0C6
MTLDPSGSIPKIIEGVDPFDEQAAQAQYLVEPPAKDPKKDELVREIYSELKKLVPDISPEEARDAFIFEFGIFLKDMDFMGLFAAKGWVSRLEVRPVDKQEETL